MPRPLTMAAVAVTFLAPAVASAQPADATARADALFSAAKQLRDAGLYAQACPNFAESKRLAPGVGITLYLADCYEHVGKTGSAWKEFRDAEKLARERNDPRAEVARGRALALEPRLSGLTIVVPAPASREAPEILLDGASIPPEQWNAAMAVDPGDHLVTVTAHGQPTRTLLAHVDAGTRGASVRVEEPAAAVPAAAPVEAAPVASDVPPAAAADSGGGARTAVGITLIGVGLVGIGVGTAFLLKYESTANPPPSCTPPPKDRDSQVASAISFSAGGVALLSALAVFLSGSHPNSAALAVSPVPLVGGGGALVRGSF